MPRQSSLCHGKALQAAAKLFVPWQRSSCRGNKMTRLALHGIVLCVAARNDVLQHCMAFHAARCFFVPRQKTTRCCIPWHVSSCHGIVLHAAAEFLVTRSYFLCHMKKRCTKAFHTVVLHSAARNDALLHSVALRIMSQHGASCHGIVRCAAANLFMLWWHCVASFFVSRLVSRQEMMCCSIAWHSA